MLVLTIINIGILDKFDKELQKLKREITSDEATEAVVALNNNRAPGKDNMYMMTKRKENIY